MCVCVNAGLSAIFRRQFGLIGRFARKLLCSLPKNPLFWPNSTVMLYGAGGDRGNSNVSGYLCGPMNVRVCATRT